MSKKLHVYWILIFLAVTAVFSAGKATRSPNVILIYTDDHGWADVGIHGQRTDVKTPNIDQLAREGVLCNDGYSTAPQCCPSRAGVMSGRYQQSFGFGHNGEGPLPLDELTLADRMKSAGYRTGFVGKWHLEPTWTCSQWVSDHLGVEKATPQTKITFEQKLPYYPENRGFDEFFKGELNRYWFNYDLNGRDRNPDGEWANLNGYRLEIQTEAAMSFIDRNQDDPFFLYLAYFAPHVPLEATQKYLDRFPGEMPERRRYALAMMAAMDDGVGQIRLRLQELGLEKDTLIFFIADNGAPLKIMMEDRPISFKGGAWNGSINTPWVGEKGMTSEGGIHVPYIFAWPGTVPSGQVCNEPVSTLDVSPTCLAAAGQMISPELDGINLLPHFIEDCEPLAERDLFWRFWGQGAIRRGDWKYTTLSDGREMLYNLASGEHEHSDLLSQYPEKADQLRKAWTRWNQGLACGLFDRGSVNGQENKWYRHYLGSGDALLPLNDKYALMDLNGDQALTESEYVEGRTSREKPLLMKKMNLSTADYRSKRTSFRRNYRADFIRKDRNADGALCAGEL